MYLQVSTGGQIQQHVFIYMCVFVLYISIIFIHSITYVFFHIALLCTYTCMD